MAADGTNGGRETIAKYVILCAGIGIVVIAVLAVGGASLPLLFVADKGGVVDKVTSNISTVFNALLPLFGTWVGTVLAYYFSKDNFQTATEATKDLLGRMEENLRKTKVENAWTPFAAIKGITLKAGQDDTAVSMSDLQNMFSDTVTRIPIFNPDNSIRYLVHRSEYYRFGFEAGINDAQGNLKTLKDMVAYRDLGTTLTTFACVASGATLADAKAKMDAVAGAQDVFVTSSGEKASPVLGWITNTDIVKYSKP